MARLITILLLINLTGLIFTQCGKNGSSEEALLYGKWAKENAPYDTIHFFRRSGQNIMSCNISMSSTQPTLFEQQYRLDNGKLSVGPTSPVSSVGFFEYSSFSWVQWGKKFKLNGNQRFLFLSSIQPDYIYIKIN